jgi:hypothetical protein
MFDPAAEIQRVLKVCETKHEALIMICGFLLGMNAKARGERPLLRGVPSGRFPRFMAPSARSDSSSPIPPRFVAFA